jgi:hypothetical protein
MQPTVGRIVYYNLKDKQGNVQVRPAIVVRVWNDTMLNLQVFTDGSNDTEYGNNIVWKTSVMQGEGVGQWDWMPYQKEQAAKKE